MRLLQRLQMGFWRIVSDIPWLIGVFVLANLAIGLPAILHIPDGTIRSKLIAIADVIGLLAYVFCIMPYAGKRAKELDR
jgi:hypothetical protein